MIIKTENPNFSRDQNNQALLNTNAEAYNLYKMQRSQLTNASSLQRQVDALKSDMTDIKDMLKVLIQRENNGTSNN